MFTAELNIPICPYRCVVSAGYCSVPPVLLCCVYALSHDNDRYSTNIKSSCQMISAVGIEGVCAYALWHSPHLHFSASDPSPRTPLSLHVQNRLCQHGDKLFSVLLDFNCSMYSLKPCLSPLSIPCSCSDISFLLAVRWCSSPQYSSTSQTPVYFSAIILGNDGAITSILWRVNSQRYKLSEKYRLNLGV